MGNCGGVCSNILVSKHKGDIEMEKLISEKETEKLVESIYIPTIIYLQNRIKYFLHHRKHKSSNSINKKIINDKTINNNNINNLNNPIKKKNQMNHAQRKSQVQTLLKITIY